jgi:hypothetical protein
MPGAIIDYVLPSNASGTVKLEILDNAGKVVKRYASTDPTLDPPPARSASVQQDLSATAIGH